MSTKKAEAPKGKLGVLVVGCGAVATTFMTGVLMVRKGLAKPVGSMTQYDKIRVGKGADKKYLHYKDIVPLADLNDIVFGTWDVYPANAYESAINAEVLKEKDINPVKDELEKIVPMKAAFDKNYAKRLTGDNTMGDITSATTSATSRKRLALTAWLCSGQLPPKSTFRSMRNITALSQPSRPL